ncbi:MAG: hypothetical protein LQ337_001095 [Flavoplaca oasis]|nr:MAG: hypothetical protein LQ337_001095 [Flavoplaca oasis]
MLLAILTALVSGAAFGNAFTDTSPFFMFSTSELLATSPQIAAASTLQETITSQLSKCPSDTYVVVTQPGVHAEDYSDRYAAPHLRRKISGEDERIRSTLTVTDVHGGINTEAIIGLVEEQCGAGLLRVDASTGSFTIGDDPKPRIINVDFPALPSTSKEQRASKLKENDVFLSSILDLLPTSKYTVIYTTSPYAAHKSGQHEEPEMYEMDDSFSSSQSHLGTKRDFGVHGKRADDNANVTLPNAPLFEKYQYFTPGIFMGLIVILPLFMILYVGISAVGSLQVSYAAFDREMGPQTAKKGQ